MARSNPVTGASVYVDDGTNGMAGAVAPGAASAMPVIPEDTYTPDGWATTDRFVGPGTYMENIDLDN